MARDNYSYRKYQRELTKKKKKEAKLQRKLDKKNQPDADIVDASGEPLPQPPAAGVDGTLPGGSPETLPGA